MITALLFLIVTCVLFVVAIARGPIWGLLAYVNIYFNSPGSSNNWWGTYLPFHNWSYIGAVVLFFSMMLHRDKLSSRGLKVVKYVFLFALINYLIIFTVAKFPGAKYQSSYAVLSYALICFAIVKTVKLNWHFRVIWVAIICFAGFLSLNAYRYGVRINSRLENIGPSDAHGSNEYALLLAAVIPLVIPFLLKGRWYERGLCFCCLPFLLNAFVLCNSRGAAVALVVAFSVTAIFMTEKKDRLKMIIVGIFIFSLLGYLADQEMIDRMASLLQTQDALSDEEQANRLSSGRMEIWGYGLDMAKDYPFGAGPSGFKFLARDYMPADVLTFHRGAAFGVRSAHNSYLQVLVEQGVLGLVVWLVICLYSILLIFKSFLRIRGYTKVDPFWHYCLFAVAVSFLSILLGSLFNSRVYYEFFWWQISLIVVLASLVEHAALDADDSVR